MGALLPAVSLGIDKKAVAVSVGSTHSCAVLVITPTTTERGGNKSKGLSLEDSSRGLSPEKEKNDGGGQRGQQPLLRHPGAYLCRVSREQLEKSFNLFREHLEKKREHFIELMTSDRRVKTSSEGLKSRNSET